MKFPSLFRTLVLLSTLMVFACSDDGDPVAPEPCVQCVVSIAPQKDNTLYEVTADTLSNGRGEHVFAGRTSTLSSPPGARRRAVIRFDISSAVPSGATIDSVRLFMTVTKTALGTGARLVNLPRVTQDWGEGASRPSGEEGSGAPATAGDATWHHTFFNTSFWNNPGGDFVATASGGTIVNQADQRYTWASTDSMVANVQSWLDVPTGNFGWTLIGDESDIRTAKRFASQQNLRTERRPSLQIFYTAP